MPVFVLPPIRLLVTRDFLVVAAIVLALVAASVGLDTGLPIGIGWRRALAPIIHSGTDHVLSNGYGIAVFALLLREASWRWCRIIAVFVLGAWLPLLFQSASEPMVIGASGGVCALLGALVFSAPAASIVGVFWAGFVPVPLPLPAAVFGAFWALHEHLCMHHGLDDGVSHATHLAGMGIGLFYSLVNFAIRFFAGAGSAASKTEAAGEKG